MELNARKYLVYSIAHHVHVVMATINTAQTMAVVPVIYSTQAPIPQRQSWVPAYRAIEQHLNTV